MTITGILGGRLKNSPSPAMHNAAFRRAGLRCLYFPFEIPPRRLGPFMRRLKSWRIKGLNVTIPYKEKVVRYLDRLDPISRAIGAVNTILLSKGRLWGYNTDAPGYLQSLQEETRFNPRGKSVVILGAGGASRAILYALASHGARKITLVNRNLRRAKGVARHFQKRFKKTRFESLPFARQRLAAPLAEADLLVNATPIGTNGTRFRDLPLANLRKGSVVSDIIYKPLKTPLLKEARKRGLKTHSGLGMLLHQGALSFALWTRQKPDLKAMRRALLQELKS